MHRVGAPRDEDRRRALPNSFAAYATDWPWLPVEAVYTPVARVPRIEPRDEIDPAADLERPGRQVVLVLDEHLGAHELVDQRIAQQRSRVEVRGDHAPCIEDVSKLGDPVQHGRSIVEYPLIATPIA